VKKILIMMGSYFPKPMANGICTHQIALELKKNGYDVHVICFNKSGDLKEDTYEGIIIHRVKMRMFFRLRFYAEDNINTWKGKCIYKVAMIINKIKKLIYAPFYPMTSPIFIYRYYKLAKRLHKENNFDIIISVYNPLEALIAGSMMKKKYKEINFAIYILDTLSNSPKVKFLSKSWTEWKGWQWEKRIYKYADIIFNMKCHEEHHKKERYDKYIDKMKIVDIPLFTNFNNDTKQFCNPFDKYNIQWVYSGTLYLGGRDPEYLCKIFTELNNKYNNRLHFYSRGNCEHIIIKYQDKSNDTIVRHGYVDRHEMLQAISYADILISIGNQESDMIPSKIFEYISTGKKIIHFYKSFNDSSIVYYKDYANVLLINENDNFFENINAIKKFIYHKQNDILVDNLKKIYIKNTPEYTVNFIKKILED